ncbi:hypothetical protein BV898_12175 [Hypsibius exemplaris]|uniref:Uncharacterized protein n=1 Tax=Hypsibius exemplaris TaxID=2072580 RepID=A0A1W0WES8_HYPEX|nr:hypothetical protein BV898_12175 [Hypsibius exemplaris]
MTPTTETPNIFSSFPSILLELFGFLPSERLKPCLRKIPRFIRIVHLTGGAAFLVVLFLQTIVDVQHSPDNANSNALLDILGWTPVFAFFTRSVVVLLLFLSRAAAYRSLCYEILKLTKSLSPDSYLRRWKRSATLGVDTILVSLCWHVFRQFSLKVATAAVGGSVNINGTLWSSEKTNENKNRSAGSEIKWYFYYFEIALFCLSQQVVVLGTTDNVPDYLSVVDSELYLQSTLISALKCTRNNQAQVRWMCERFNQLFVDIFATSHMLDQLCIMGWMAFFNSGLHTTTLPPLMWAFRFLSIFCFSGYSIVLLWPLVSLHQEHNDRYAAALDRNSSSTTTERVKKRKPGSNLVCREDIGVGIVWRMLYVIDGLQEEYHQKRRSTCQVNDKDEARNFS